MTLLARHCCGFDFGIINYSFGADARDYVTLELNLILSFGFLCSGFVPMMPDWRGSVSNRSHDHGKSSINSIRRLRSLVFVNLD